VVLLHFAGEQNYPTLLGLGDMPEGWGTEQSPSSWLLPGKESERRADELQAVFVKV